MMSFELVIKYLSGKASPDEALRIDKWIEASAENRNRFAEIQASWLKAGNETMSIPETAKAWKKFSSQLNTKKGGKIITLKRFAIAAGFVGICFLAWWGISRTSLSGTQVAEAGNETVDITLADGSQIRLYPSGKLTYPGNFEGKERKVRLEGNGFFWITPNKEKPFVVEAGNCSVQVLGTTFDISQEGDSTIVSVVTGTVKVSNSSSQTIVTPGEIAVCNRKQQIYETGHALRPAGNAESTVNTGSEVLTGSFEFTDRRLEDIAIQLSSHFKTEIVLGNPSLKDCRGTLSFTDETLEKIVENITLVFNIDSRNEKGKITFTGTCN